MSASSLHTPFSLLEAEIALYQVASSDPTNVAPDTSLTCLGSCPANLRIDTDQEEDIPKAFTDTVGIPHLVDRDYRIQCDFRHGQYLFEGKWTFPQFEGHFILVVRWIDDRSRQWQKLQFYDVTLPQNSLTTDGRQLHQRSMRFRARRFDAFAGSTVAQPATADHAAIPATAAPDLTPDFNGYLWYVSPQLRFPAYSYDFVGDAWTSLPQNLSAISSNLAVDFQSSLIRLRDFPNATWSTAMSWGSGQATLKSGGQAHLYGANPNIFGSTETIWVEFRSRGHTYFVLGANGNLAIPDLTEDDGTLPVPANAAHFPGSICFPSPNTFRVIETLIEPA